MSRKSTRQGALAKGFAAFSVALALGLGLSPASVAIADESQPPQSELTALEAPVEAATLDEPVTEPTETAEPEPLPAETVVPAPVEPAPAEPDPAEPAPPAPPEDPAPAPEEPVADLTAPVVEEEAALDMVIMQEIGTGYYQPSNDASNPTTWYESGSPAQATIINSFSSSYVGSTLQATWTRPQTTGASGWSIEYTVAPERWGRASGSRDVPQPDRSLGGIVVIIDNQSYADGSFSGAYLCTYTSGADYPSSNMNNIGNNPNCTLVPGVLTAADGGSTLYLNLPIPANLLGQAGCPSSLGSTGYIRSWTGNRNIQAWASPVTVTPPSTCGSLTIEKKNEAGAFLAGAQFTVTPNPVTGTGSTTATTAANGTFVFASNVKPDITYTVTETAPPPGYLLPAVTSQQMLVGKNQSKTLTFVDPLGSVKFTKHDETGAALGGATFVITATAGAAANAPWDLDAAPITVVDNTGQAGYTGRDTNPAPGAFTVADLPTGTYSIVESVAPDGFQVDPTPQSFTISQATPHPTVGTAFVNLPNPGELQIEKSFDSTVPQGYGDIDFSGTYTCTLDGSTVASGTWLSTGAGDAVLTPDEGMPAADMIPAGAECSAMETPPTGSTGLPNSSYEWGAPAVTGSGTIVTQEISTLTVTNTVDRVYGSFSVTKEVVGTADDGLEYSGDWQCVLTDELLDDETVSGTWGPVVDGETWTSSASDEIPLGAECSVVNEEGLPAAPVDGDPSYSWDGDPDLGTPVDAAEIPSEITVTNTTKRELGSVTWTKVDAADILLSGSEWTLTGPSLFNEGEALAITDCTEAPCAGPDMDPTGGAFLLEDLPWGDYTLTETKAPAGYYLSDDDVTFTIGKTSPASLEVNLDPIVNIEREGPVLPLTGGIGREFFPLMGAGILFLGLGGAGYAQLRKNRKEGSYFAS